jgi:hypothetical protein
MNNQRIMPTFAPTDSLQSFSDFSTYANVSRFDAYSPKTILSLEN